MIVMSLNLKGLCLNNPLGWSEGEYESNSTQALWDIWQAARAQQPNLSRIAKKKIDQVGATIHGVLVKNEAGAWAAVSDAGRVMWLDGFEGQANNPATEGAE